MSEENKNKVLELTKQINDIQNEILLAKKQIIPLNKALTENQKKLNKLIQERNVFTQFAEVYITDHAIVRYMERIKKINIEKIKEEIVPLDLRKTLAFKSEDISVNDHQLRLLNGVVVTVLPQKYRHGFVNKLKDFFTFNME